VHLAHQVGGDLAGPEAGHADLRGDALQLAIDSGVDVLPGNRDPVGALEALVQRLDSLHDGKLLPSSTDSPAVRCRLGIGATALAFARELRKPKPSPGRFRVWRNWCGRRDSNPHIFRYQDLNLA